MNGAHDMGGTMGFGPVHPEPGDGPDTELFHDDWERHAMALTVAAGMLGRWNLDESRHARENRPPAAYLGSSYYAIWIEALESLLVRHDLVSTDELAEGRARDGGAGATPISAGTAARALRSGAPTARPDGCCARARPARP